MLFMSNPVYDLSVIAAQTNTRTKICPLELVIRKLLVASARAVIMEQWGLSHPLGVKE